MLHAPLIDDEFVSVSVVARELAIAENTVRLWTRRGALPCMRLASGMRLYRRADIERIRALRAAEAAAR